jgi:hypothetical protein
LEPSSSVVAVVTKSTGSVRAQLWTVLGFSSGEENRIVSTTHRANTTPSAMHASLTMSYDR